MIVSFITDSEVLEVWLEPLRNCGTTGTASVLIGHNIESSDLNGYINPTATTLTEQTVGVVSFSWTAPSLQDVPRWKVVTPGSAFSLQETLITPGLDTVTTITRTINTTTTTETTTTFGQ